MGVTYSAIPISMENVIGFQERKHLFTGRKTDNETNRPRAAVSRDEGLPGGDFWPFHNQTEMIMRSTSLGGRPRDELRLMERFSRAENTPRVEFSAYPFSGSIRSSPEKSNSRGMKGSILRNHRPLRVEIDLREGQGEKKKFGAMWRLHPTKRWHPTTLSRPENDLRYIGAVEGIESPPVVPILTAEKIWLESAHRSRLAGVMAAWVSFGHAGFLTHGSYLSIEPSQ